MTKIYAKRFCVECNSERNVYVVKHETYALFHCRECKQEAARVGDVSGRMKPTHVPGGIIQSRDEAAIDREGSLTLAAQANPDLLSDEQTLWPRRDEEAEADREDAMRTFRVALAGLTTRQRQVLETVRVHKTQTGAAHVLGISQPVVKKTLNAIQKKLLRKGINSSNRGQE